MAYSWQAFAVLVCSAAAAEWYDERLAANYVRINHVVNGCCHNIPTHIIRNWSCGAACDAVHDVSNAEVVHFHFPFDAVGMVAEYGSDECIVAFRGSTTAGNYVLDDLNAFWHTPYKESCPECMVHAGFHDVWKSLKEKVYGALDSRACGRKRIRLTGHSLGGAVAAMAAFDMADRYVLKHVYTFGQPRVSNVIFNDVMISKLAVQDTAYFRVVSYRDPYPHMPPLGWDTPYWVDKHGADIHFMDSHGGYRHFPTEVFYDWTEAGYWRVCDPHNGEDPLCSDQYEGALDPDAIGRLVDSIADKHVCCHCTYVGLDPCGPDDLLKPCIQALGYRRNKIKYLLYAIAGLAVLSCLWLARCLNKKCRCCAGASRTPSQMGDSYLPLEAGPQQQPSLKSKLAGLLPVSPLRG
jgi:hypothetical protein